MPLGASMLVYKENSIWRMSLSQDVFIFRFSPVFTSFGAVGYRAVSLIPKKHEHLVFTGSDLVRHNGTQAESILTPYYRRLFPSLLNLDAFKENYWVIFEDLQEAWFCYVPKGKDKIAKALVYNYETKLMTSVDLVEGSYLRAGIVVQSGTAPVWNSQDITWDNATNIWDDQQSVYKFKEDVLNTVGADFHLMQQGYQHDTVDYNSYIERTGIAFVPNLDNSVETHKLITRIWPKVTYGKVTVKVSVQDTLDGPITYSPPMLFDPSMQNYLDLPFPLNGRYYGVKFEGVGDEYFELHGYDLDLTLQGIY